MKSLKNIGLSLIFTLLFAMAASAQLTGPKSIPGDYADLAAAIADLNTQGVGVGGVTFNLVAGNPQTAPAGGYVIGGAGSAVLTTASAANPIVFNGGSNTITAPTPQTSGNLNDGIFKLIGADWVTISGFTMSENAANTTTAAGTNNMTEWGVALLYVTATDGAQNNTIQNNTIDLDRTYQNTFGIYSNSTHTAASISTSATATGAAGGNDNLKVYTNNITDVNNGIVHVGPTAAADHNTTVDIGGVAAGTGNNITNYGTTGTFSGYANVSGTVNGILVRNTRNFNISFNTVNSSNGGVTVGTLNGIQIPAASNPPTGTLTQTINNNAISLRAGAAGSGMNGINMPSGSVNATTTNSINNNDFNTFGHTVAGTAGITFISHSGNPLVQNMNGNTFTGLSVNTTGTITFFSFAPTMIATASFSLSTNIIVGNFIRTGAGTTTVWSSNASSVAGSTHTITNNNFSNFTLTGASAFTGISDTDGPGSGGPTKNVNGNTFNNIVTGAGTVIPMSVNFSGANSNVNNNSISNITSGNSLTALTLGSSNLTGMTSSGNSIFGLNSAGTAVTAISVAGIGATVSKNKIYEINGTLAGAAVVTGIANSGSTTNSTITIVNNLIGNLTAPASTSSNGVIGINVSGSATTSTMNVYFNTIYLNNLTSGAGFGSSGIMAVASATSTTSTLNLRNNIIVNTSVQNGAGLTVAYRRSAGGAGTLANYASTSNNNDFFAGTPSATNLIYSDGTSSAQTLVLYKNGVFTAGTIAPRDSSSVSENPPFLSTTGLSSNFLHINPATPTQIESGGASIAGFTDDFDGNVRAGTPDIGADEFAGTVLDLTGPAISYTPLANTSSTGDRTLNITVTDASGVPTAGIGRPVVYYRKNAGAYTSTQCAFVSGSSYNCGILSAALGGVALADIIDYYVAAQDNAGNVSVNPSTGAGGFTTNPPGAVTPPTTPNTYTIVGTFSGSFNVGVGGAYTSLTNVGGIFEAINNSEVTGNVTINITTDLSPTTGTLVGESGTVALNQFATPFAVTIQSSGGARVIEGAAAGGLIRFNGADSVFMNCNAQLLFRNQSSAPALTFLNDSTVNNISFCTLESANISTTSGTVLFSTSTGTLGNSNNVLNGNQIRERTDVLTVPANGVYSSGTAGASNATNFVSNGSVFNFTNIGVFVSGTGAGNGWTVNTNSIYQSSARTTATEGIAILGGSGHQITNNSIGGSTVLAGGTHYATSSTFRGIDLSVGTASPTFVGNNTIKNIRSTLTGSFASSYGIFVQAGRVDIGNPVNTFDGNTIGSANIAERYEISGDSYAIRATSTSTVNIRNNTINNFGTAAGVPTGEFYFGISTEGAGGAHSIFNNTVTNVTNGSTTDATFNTQTIGIVSSATGVQTIRGNAVSNVGNTSVAAVATLNNRIWGMVVGGAAAGSVIERNNISGIYGSSPTTGARADVVTGLQVQTAGTNATVTNNFISLDGGTAGSSDRSIFGILELATGGTNTYQFNSVNVIGTSTGANNSYGFNRNSLQTVVLRNNIFADTRTAGTGFHVAMANTNGSATGWSNTASNNNLLWNTDPTHITQWLGAVLANNRTLAAFQTDSGGDAATTAGNPQFISNTDLHITNTSPAIGTGVTFGGVTTDYDNDPRPGTAPDRGADELVQTDAGTFPAGTFYNALVSPASYAGNVTVTNTLYLNGAANVGANTLTVGCNATIVGASSSNFIIGNLERQFCSLGVYDFPVGSTGNGSAFNGGEAPEGFTAEYSPMVATLNAGTTFPSSLTVNIVDTWLPNLGQTSSISRYWNVTETGTVNADMLFQYLPEDVYGNEPLYSVFKWDGTNTTMQPGSVNIALDQFTATGVTSFSGWAAGVRVINAAEASISGRVTTAGGAGIRNATVRLTGGDLTEPRIVQTGQFGSYTFGNLQVGQTYVLEVGAKRFRFSDSTRIISLQDDLINVDFTANPNE